MLKDSDYIFAGSQETVVEGLPLGVRVFVAAGRAVTEKEISLIYNHIQDIYNVIWTGHTLQSKENLELAAKEKADIINLFPSKIYVEEIPNGYCNEPCCVHRPWFIVTTPIGHIKIGWRKRVINIDWTHTDQKKTAEQLFPNEDVTKYEHAIHAYGYEKAKEYLGIIHG